MDIVKTSGEKERYDRDKFCESLRRVGATKKEVDAVCRTVERTLRAETPSHELFKEASRELGEINPAVAARYNLKRGIQTLGPAGFFFEQYVEAVLRAYGYHTMRNAIMQGVCAEHEIDVVAHKDDRHFLIEAKYRNRPGGKTDITVAMYADARLADISPRQKEYEPKEREHAMWLITNAKFTSSAIKYGECKGLKMTGWSHPKGNESLEELVRGKVLYPVTVLSSVDRSAREAFARGNIILAQDLADLSENELEERFSLKKDTARKIKKEATLLVSAS